jgi:outer membrane receptor protein involved in Fe transport
LPLGEEAAEAGDAGENAEGEKSADELDKLMSMDLDQLQNVSVQVDTAEAAVTIPTGTLTATTEDSVSPYTVTHITREMIEKSGARNLNELLDEFVPNLQVIRHHSFQNHIGIRGIVSDREDKYLLRVNGRVMNQHFLVGADSERDVPLLRDIDFVDVIRGPGSTTYGPGAIAGVINIQTLNGLTFQGFDVQGRQGFEQYMTTTEMRYGKKLGEETGFFAYYGYGDSDGADADDAPVIYGRTGAMPNGYSPAEAGEPVPFWVPNDGATFHGHPQHKVHFEYTQGTFDCWARYLYSSYFNPNQMRNMYRPPYGIAPANADLLLRPGAAGQYEQLTFFASKVFELSDEFQLTGIASWDKYDFVESRLNATHTYLPSAEEETYLRAMAQYTPDECQAGAIGYEVSREMFGLPSDLSDFPTRSARLGIIDDPWVTWMHSVFGEYRVSVTDPMTVILAGRVDKHTYSNYLFSPRISVLYEVNDWDLIKFNIGESVRKACDEELRAQWLANETIADAETLKNIELRWEREPYENLWYGASVFYQSHEVVGFTGSLSRSTLLGTFDSWGWELEANYVDGSDYFTISQGYVKLIRGTLLDPSLVQGISAAPYGFGSDFSNWSPWLTKFAWARDVDDCTNLSSSLRVYWGFPGARDLTMYNGTLPTPSGSIGSADPGYDKAFEASVFLDFGYQRRLTEHLSWRLDLYNVLGWADIDLNKRNYINRNSDYRSEAAAVGVSATANF